MAKRPIYVRVPPRIATAIAFVCVPTKVLLRFLEWDCDTRPKSAEQMKMLAAVQRLPRTWRPPIALRLHELRQATDKMGGAQ